MGIDYKALIKQGFEDLEELLRKREEIEFQLATTNQLLRAAFNMLPKEEKQRFEAAFIDRQVTRAVGLTEAIRGILTTNPDRSFTAIQVREELERSGFDFTGYSSNPLASIHTVLKRFKPTDVETTTVDGAAAYKYVRKNALAGLAGMYEGISGLAYPGGRHPKGKTEK